MRRDWPFLIVLNCEKWDVFEEGTREGGKNGKAKQQMDQ